ncbi:MAG: coproporphyrinogen III oxidase [Sulfurimonas sp.]|nr:coproporphyrinogen III oxidase [Sulfurimonas sp.]
MRIPAQNPQAIEALSLVEELQAYFASKLNNVSATIGSNLPFVEVEWMRDAGRHGGGTRYEARDTALFNRGSINVSQVHYDDNPNKQLGSATAISTIIHPLNPNVPSMHMHISWTQMRDGSAYWRIMADLNPALKNEDDKNAFDTMLKSSSGSYYEEGILQGNKYFDIPVLKRTRGVSHFYLENFNTGDFEKDYAFAKNMGEKIIDAYTEIITQAINNNHNSTEEEKAEQLAYHTLYLFQVLTLDRGTTSGLLVHDQNDIGIMGSIPSHINRNLLTSWVTKMPKPQDALVLALLDAMPKTNPTPIEIDTKKKLAQVVRTHYAKHKEALSMQASGGIIPPTVKNHKD